MAKVAQVIPDPKATGMYLALIEPGSYFDFVNAVPFSGSEGVIERGVLNDTGRISGSAQATARPISAVDFNRILSIGLAEGQPELPRSGEATDMPTGAGFSDCIQASFMFEEERVRVSQLSSRIIRHRLFRRLILQAYDKRCAVTGLKLINGGGRAEVDAAHIRPVEANGPDMAG